MSAFSDLLAADIKDSGLSIPYLAGQCGISPSLLAKMKSGQRLSDDEQIMNRLFHALRLSDRKYQELVEAYHIERIGSQKYHCYLACMQTINRFNDLEHIPSGYMNRSVSYEFSYRATFHTRQDIKLVFSYLFDQCLAHHEPMRLIYPSSDGFVSDYIIALSHSVSSAKQLFPITHIIRLYPSSATRSSYLNIAPVSNALYTLAMSNNYDPYYYYNDEAAVQLYPYMVLTPSYALMVDESISNGILLNDPDMIASLQNTYSAQLKKCQPLTLKISDFNEYLSHMLCSLSNLSPDGRKAHSLSSYPCLMTSIPLQIAARHLPSALLNDPRIQEYMHRRNSLYDYEMINTFTLSGLEQFMETGIIEELPDGFHTPLSDSERVEILKSYLHAVREERMHIRLLKEDKLTISHHFNITTYAQGETLFLWKYPQMPFVYDQLLEHSFADTLRDFLIFLPDSDFTWNEEESKKLLFEYADHFVK
ncbi:MAG: hypothetical protein LKF52_00240 [Butyrivibrio sp.]|jgi:transcriptional regulator with XRE-family HTH domain|nr:hypothetical protein [Butyrivibrio sp.]